MSLKRVYLVTGRFCFYLATIMFFLVAACLLSALIQALPPDPTQAAGEDPLLGYNFMLELDGSLAGYFTKCSHIGSESEVIEWEVPVGEDEVVIKKVPGKLAWNNVILSRGITSDTQMWEWRRWVEVGNMDAARKLVYIVMLDRNYTEVARWELTNAWPCRIEGPNVLGSDEIGIEEIEITCERMERVTASHSGPEMIVKGNSFEIVDGDVTPSAADSTNFGSADITTGSVVHTFVIKNIGTEPLNLTGTPKVAVGGACAADFTVTATAQPASPVAAGGGSTTFKVTFDPSATGVRTATISIANNDADENPYNFTLQGTGLIPGISVSPPSIDFGSVLVDSPGNAQTITVTNESTGDLHIGAITIIGTDFNQFELQSDNCSRQKLVPGGSSTLEVVFNPISIGDKTATLSIPFTVPDEVMYVALSGRGVQPATLVLAADPINVPADGSSTSIIIATVDDQDGNPVPDGTDVVFETNHDILGSSTVTKQTSGGFAAVYLTSESSTETVIATVTAASGNVSDATAVFFIPAGGTEVKGSTTRITQPGPDTVDATGQAGTVVEKSGTGTPTVTVAEYASNPGGGAPSGFSAMDKHIDVHADNVTGVTEIVINVYYTDAELAAAGVAESSLRLRWWNGSAWIECTDGGVTYPAGAPTYRGYMWAKIRATGTTPDLDDLEGAVFGGMGAPAAAGVPSPGGGSVSGDVPTSQIMTVNMPGKLAVVRVSYSGELLASVAVTDADNKFTVQLDKGTRMVCANNKPPQRIELTLAGSPPPPDDAVIVGPIYELNAYAHEYSSTPSPVTISPPARMIAAYDADKLPENTLQIVTAYYDERAGKWVELETAGYVAGGVQVPNTMTSRVSHFTSFAVLAKVAGATPARFGASNLTISPAQAQPGQKVIISLGITNSGGTTGDYNLELTVDGTARATKQVTVSPGASRPVTFAVTGDGIGRHRVEMAGLAGEFEIKEQQNPGVNMWLVGSILGVVLVILSLAWLAWTRRRLTGY